MLNTELSEGPTQELIKNINDQTEVYVFQTDPYDPQAIADLRPIAYQKTIVMHYVNNLINRGDMLFRENTRESIVEAEMFYVEAYDLLGQEPLDRARIELHLDALARKAAEQDEVRKARKSKLAPLSEKDRYENALTHATPATHS